MPGYVYILTNRRHGTLYVGVTNDIVRRVHEHRTGATDGFTKQHDLHRLVFFETHETVPLAIEREKQLKRWKRDWKIELIEAANPDWDDLYPGIVS
ncbi:MAG: GIY-YIG nuclease family protein [Alphaproteobacteria bacterium]|nr:GIY-YIG nuclease family protein [Alphaproteobacteria bacterium]